MKRITECIEREYDSLDEAKARAPHELMQLCADSNGQLESAPSYVERDGKGVVTAMVSRPAPQPAPAPATVDPSEDGDAHTSDAATDPLRNSES